MTDIDDTPATPSPLKPFRYPIFRDVWLANLLSRFGGLIQSVGASWLMVSLGASATLISLVQTSTTLPIMLFSLLAGALADTFDRRRLMLIAQLFMLVVSLLLSLAAWFGVLTPWLLLAFTFLIGTGAALNGPAWQASVGDMVPRDDLPAAVALNSMGFNVARSTGPAVGGLVVAAFGAAAAFAVNTASYLGLLFVLTRWRSPARREQLQRETLGRAMGAGLRYVALSPSILTVLVRSLVFGLGASAIPALMPLVARDLVAGGPLTFGLLLGAFGIGAVVGAYFSSGLRRTLSTEGFVRFALIALAAASIATAFSHSVVLTMAALFVGGAGWVLALSTFNVTVQMASPRWVVGRTLALYQMSAFGGMALGSWLWGSVTEQASLETALLCSAGVSLGCLLMGLVRPLPMAGKADLEPLGRWKAPTLAVPIEGRSGPVVTTIEYRIDDDKLAEFLHLMVERRRVRRRDGARHWLLLRDLEQPAVWVERYDTATWTETVRHNERATRADADIGERLRALNAGNERPHVRRMLARDLDAVLDDADITAALAQPLTDPSRQA
ncbi:MFS transporter [Sphingomonas prati]|uniref:MFS family permease n=1 Tax=Sphingomonas prati TaxID=1843237 RepID=A0A7W9BT83_9SPHN|nr:MFS transporter [Sphingomonas prati]MBB5729681.1 MFS family permease [Sphingomonas prati]GGE90288.1 MFS transporter [Sphingomonas prati]